MPKKLPDWIATRLANIKQASTKHARCTRYYVRIYTAWPSWADDIAIRQIYHEMRRARKKGRNVVIDHIVPLSSPLVCGLHNEFNLELIEYSYNEAKSNNWWPMMWNEQTAMFDLLMHPQQLRLGL